MNNLYLIDNARQLLQNYKIDFSRCVVIDLDNFSKHPSGKKYDFPVVPLEESCDKELFEKKYIDFIAKLGQQQNSIYWWANALSEKNSLNSKLFGRLYKLACFNEMRKKTGDEDIAVICSDQELKEQLRINYQNNFIIHYSLFLRAYNCLKNVFSKSKGILKQLARAVNEYGKLLFVRRILRGRKTAIGEQSSCVVFRTWADHRNYKSGTYEDPYFKNLPDFFLSTGRKILFFAEVLSDFKSSVIRFKQDCDRMIIPTDFFLKGIDILKCLVYTYFKRPAVNGDIFFDESNVARLVSDELLQDIYTTHYFDSFIQYFCCLRLAESVSVERLIYTFENYAWEKMSIMGLRRGNPDIKTIGFQHAFISKNSFKYFPGKSEKKILPLPDRIVTMGKRTREIMRKFGDYPDAIFAAGCALRQEYLFQLKPLSRNINGDIFVPFTITIEDTVKLLRFLFLAGLGKYQKKVYLRFHPVTPIKDVFDSMGFDIPGNFVVSDNPPMHTEMERCCVVLYTWTTVCLEALKMGRPVIYLDANYPLEVDPLFECGHLKGICRRPNELIEKIERMLNINDDIYKAELEKAQEYLDDYFMPVNDRNIRSFIN